VYDPGIDDAPATVDAETEVASEDDALKSVKELLSSRLANAEFILEILDFRMPRAESLVSLALTLPSAEVIFGLSSASDREVASSAMSTPEPTFKALVIFVP